MAAEFSARPSTIICTEQQFPEFPDMLFGKSSEGTVFFDATEYLQKQHSSLAVDQFFQQYEQAITALAESYNLDKRDIHLVNPGGHHLIDGNFIYLFIAFVEPSFWAYMFDRIHEVFSNGICLSDSFILQSAKERLNPDVIIAAMGDGQD